MQLRPSLTVAQLDRASRAASSCCLASADPYPGLTLAGGGLGGHGHQFADYGGRASSLGYVRANSTVGAGAGGDEDLIVLRKDDLHTILTAKPTLLIGRELVSLITTFSRISYVGCIAALFVDIVVFVALLNSLAPLNQLKSATSEGVFWR